MNPFRYCGEYFDRESDTIYLRARSYDPGTGRFVSEDFVRGVARKLPNGQETPDPLSLHRYAYCHNNPILYSDPTGEFVITATFLLIAGGALLFGAIGGAVGGHVANQKGATGWGVGAAVSAISAAAKAATVAAATNGEKIVNAATVAAANGEKIVQAGQAISNITHHSSSIFQNGKLYETAITLKDGKVVNVAAEVVINGKNLLLNNIAIYSNAGDIPNQAGTTIIRELYRTTQTAAYQNGFETLRIYGERAMGSSSANPGMIIDRFFDLVKIFGGK